MATIGELRMGYARGTIISGFVFLVASSTCVRAVFAVEPAKIPDIQAQPRIGQNMADHEVARQKRLEVDADNIKRAIERDPTRVANYRRLARTLQDLERHKEAIAICRMGLLLDPVEPHLYSIAGMCYFKDKNYYQAAEFLQNSVWFDARGIAEQLWLGYSLYHLGRYEAATEPLQAGVALKPRDFEANYWLGLCYFLANRFDKAIEPLQRAAEINPGDYYAQHWGGTALLRAGRGREAIAMLSHALELRPNSIDTKRSLFAAYLLVGDSGKAFRLFPIFVAGIGAGLMLIYFVGFIILLSVTLKIRAPSPGLIFSAGWIFLFTEGQVAFLLLFAPISIKALNNPLAGLSLAAAPIIATAATAFARRPWGGPFCWPLRLGGRKVIGLGLLFLICSALANFVIASGLAHHYGHAVPLQKTIPLIREALASSPAMAVLTIAFIAPMVEEILFRGLLFAALQKWLSAGVVVVITALLFAAFHLELIGFLPIFGLGLVLGWARLRTGSIGLPIFLHCLNNCIAIAALRFIVAP